MRTTLTAPDRLAVDGILAAVLADPGMTNEAIRRQLGHPEYRVRKVLTILRQQGKVGLVRYGRNDLPRWYPPAEAAAIRARFEREAAEKRRERNRIYSQRYNEAQRLGSVDDDSDGEPVRRRVDAHAPLPFVCRAPCSVFELGGRL